MKILITYASAGIGHRKAAEAVYNYLKANFADLDLAILDILDKTNPVFKFFYNRGYLFLVSHALWLWRVFFSLTSFKYLGPLSRNFGFFINRVNARKFIRYIIAEKPDFIVATHFLPAELSAYTKNAFCPDIKIVTAITDFGVHPFWVSEGTDIYVVASGATKQKLIMHGVMPDKIKEFGIPTDAKFLHRHNKEELRVKLGLDKEKFTLLIITGSFGIGPIEQLVSLLNQDAQVLVVCANNKELYRRLKARNYPDAKIFGFIDNVQELMALSDIAITKPGGLSISEILVTELVPVFISPIPGQESENINVLNRYGIGFHVNDVGEIRRIVLDFKAHPQKMEEIKENIRKIKKPDAARDICNAICQGSI